MFYRRLLSVCLSVLLCIPTTVSSSVQDPGSAASNAELQNLDRLMSFAREIRTIVDTGSLDPEAILDAHNYEASEIIEFVKQSISFEAYPGVLRGAEGTLQSRAGNSLDQSILLAKLLKDAGFSARIVRAQLNGQNALKVLGELARPLVPAPPMGDADSIAQLMERYGMVRPLTPDARSRLVEAIEHPIHPESNDGFEEVVETTKWVLEALKDEGLTLIENDALDELKSESSDYFWVQYKEFASDGWRAAHPVFQGPVPFDEPDPEQMYVDSIPEELQHRLRFQVFIERKTGSKLEVIPVSSPWERPVSSLIGKPLTFANIPDTLTQAPDGVVDLEAEINDVTYYLPGFLGDSAPGAMYFDLNGNLIDPMVAGTAAAGVVKEVGRAFGDALGALGGEDIVPTLTAQWLEFTLIEPGGQETTYRRSTLDRIGVHARSEDGTAAVVEQAGPSNTRTLLQRHTFMVHTGRISRAFSVDDGANRLLGNEEAFRDTILLDRGQGSTQSKASSLPGDWIGHLSLFGYFDMADELGTKHRVYRSGPALVIHSEGLAPDSGYTSSIDIVSNPRRAIRIDDQARPWSDPALLVEAGVWETTVEGMVLPTGGDRASTSLAIKKASEQKIPIHLIKTPDSLDDLILENDTKAAIQADLERGYVALVPSRVPEGSEVGWWRIDPATGETLGQIGDGRGSEIVKYLLLTASFGFFTYGTIQCAKDMAAGASDGATACCLGMTAGFFVVGVYFGAAVTSANAAAAAAGSGAYIDPVGAWLMYRVGSGGAGWGLSKLCKAIVERSN